MIEGEVGIYGNLTTFIQLMAAIYITIALDDVLFNRFWTPDIYKTTLDILKKYDLNQPTIYVKQFEIDLEHRFKTLESLTRKRGFFNVCICMFFLVYNALLGLSAYTSQYPFVIYLLSFIEGYGILLFSRRLFKRRLYLCLCLGIFLISLVLSIKLFNKQNFNPPAIDNIFDSTKILWIACLLILPIIYQLFLTWVYSKGYTQYLQCHVSSEAQKYNQAKEALTKHDDDLIPEDYRSCFATTVQNRTQDVQLTKIDQHLYEELKKICCKFTLWDIIKKLKFKETINESTENIQKLNDEDETVEQADQKKASSTQSYAQMVAQYRQLTPTPSMSKFCNENNLDIDTFKKEYMKAIKK